MSRADSIIIRTILTSFNVNKNPTDATVCRYLFTAELLYMFRVSQHPSAGVLKTVPAASGKGHTTSSSTSSRLQPATRIPPQLSHTEIPTHIETRTHDQCGDTIEKLQAPDDGCINVRNMLRIEEVK